MKNIRVLAVSLAFVMAATVAFAQAPAPKTTKNPVPKSIAATVIVLPGEATGGPDAGLNQGLENFLGAPLDIKIITRDEAMKDPKFSGLNLDYMPLYLLAKTPFTQEKLGEDIQRGGLKTTNDFIVFEKQTRYGVYVGKERKANLLEIFVMSQCPYGVMAENRIIDAKKLGRIPENIQVNLRYIVSPGRGNEPFGSLHGAAEWEENVRQLIIKDKYPAKFWKYLEIRNKNYQSSLWDVAAEEAGLNPNIFRKYWKHGIELLKKDMEYASQFNVQGSPTFLWEGRVVTDLGGLANIPGLEGLAQMGNYGGGQQMPQGQC